eukprot:scaffold86010_cov37-Tisochrysis_lutea.AAC.3
MVKSGGRESSLQCSPRLSPRQGNRDVLRVCRGRPKCKQRQLLVFRTHPDQTGQMRGSPATPGIESGVTQGHITWTAQV